RFIRRADPPPTVLSPLSLHDALPIWIIRSWARMLTESRARGQRNRVCAKVEHWHIQYGAGCPRPALGVGCPARSGVASRAAPVRDRKSTRLNSSHVKTSYAVFCLKKK